jgi:hypothetical protein
MSRKADFDCSFPDEEDLWVDLPDKPLLVRCIFSGESKHAELCPLFVILITKRGDAPHCGPTLTARESISEQL